MSDSDDTDILLLIPPNLFIVPSPDSDDSAAYRYGTNDLATGVVSQILDHVQSLENRINVIESRDNSLEVSLIHASSELQSQLLSCNVAAPPTVGDSSNRQSLCRITSLLDSPAKMLRRSSVTSLPGSCGSPSRATDTKKYDTRPGPRVRRFDISDRPIADSRILEKNDDDFGGTNFSYDTDVTSVAVAGSIGVNSVANPTYATLNSTVAPIDRAGESKETELSEVDRLLREMEATEVELTRRINCSKSHCYSGGLCSNGIHEDSRCALLARTDVRNVESKMDISNVESLDDDLDLCRGKDDRVPAYIPVPDKVARRPDESSGWNKQIATAKSNLSIAHSSDSRLISDGNKSNGWFRRVNDNSDDSQRSTNPTASSRVDSGMRQSKRLDTLLNFWDCDDNKSREEMLQIELEKEKFRREHCEHVIQDLQKRLLEQQERVAVACRVDSEKKAIMSEFQRAWSHLKNRWESLEKDNSKLEEAMKNITEKHRSEMTVLQDEIKRGDDELSKALDMAAGYKATGELLAKEKLIILKNHADELSKYTLHVEQADERYEKLKMDYDKILERGKQLDELCNDAQRELNRERVRNSEVRNEMAVIHKALDACETELTILRQEKENLSLKIKEERGRNCILEENKDAIVRAMNDAKNAEEAAKDEAKALINNQEQIRCQLRKVYQNQLDDLVRTKLSEFQQQLDAAELNFQINLETRQRAIAECAARKIKSIIDKHQLEINLLEEKHMEERRLCEIQLAQASEKCAMLESQLNTQCVTKIQLAEQLHSVMQKQWQQALQIISGGNIKHLSPLQRLNAEEFFEAKKSSRYNLICRNKDGGNHTRPDFSSSSSQNLQTFNSQREFDNDPTTLTTNDGTPLTSGTESNGVLRKYIQMIFDMQQSKDDSAPTGYPECGSPSPLVREVPRKHYTKKNAIA